MSKNTLKLAGIVDCSVVDGPGVRVVVFAQGCPHECPGCHNAHTWDFAGGRRHTVEEIVDIVKQNPMCKGVTFSGGEPFCQPAAFSVLARELKSQNYEVAAYSGYTFEQIARDGDMSELLQELDVLVDGRYIIDRHTLSAPFIGSENQRIIDVKSSLITGEPVCVNEGRWRGSIG